MPVIISTQSQAQAARRALKNCYICAHPLPVRGSPDYKSISRDHVIPTALLSLETAAPGADWPLILDIHHECEEKHKRNRDQLAKVIQILGSSGALALDKKELGLFRRLATVSNRLIDGKQQPVIEGMDDAVLAAFLWVRGCHAALYGKVLPTDVDHITRSPSPMHLTDSADPKAALQEERQDRIAILTAVSSAIRSGSADKIVLYAGAIMYQCTWMHMVDDSAKPWRCFWALDLPMSPEWSNRVAGEDVPWYGGYESDRKPPTASEIAVPISHEPY